MCARQTEEATFGLTILTGATDRLIGQPTIARASLDGLKCSGSNCKFQLPVCTLSLIRLYSIEGCILIYRENLRASVSAQPITSDW